MASNSPKASKKMSAPRVWFVDILRLIASFQMINGHTLDAVLVTSIRQGVFYERYLWTRGLVSVSFLAVAGIAFHLSTLARFEKHKSNPVAVKRRFRRALIIVLVGYALSFPFGAFKSDPELQRLAWFYFRSVGVLQCIGTSLIMLEMITLLAKTKQQVVVASAILAAVFFALAPAGDGLVRDGQPQALLNWLSHQGGSQFPLLPWSGFVFAGLVVGAIAMPDAGRTPFFVVLGRLLGITAVCAVSWQLAEAVSFGFFDAAIHHASSAPAKSLEKLTAVFALIFVLAVLSRPIRTLPAVLRALSSETLTIFAVHLMVLFYPGIAIARRFDHRLPLSWALLVSAGMVIFTCGYAYAWHRWKTRGQRRH